MKKQSKKYLWKGFFGCFLIFISMLGVATGAVFNSHVYAEPEDEVVVTDNEEIKPVLNEEVSEEDENNEEEKVEEEKKEGKSSKDSCKQSLGAVGWLVCPITEKIAQATDWLYEKIEAILVIDPIPREDGSPIYEIWKYCLNITNIVFIIFLLVVIYSQITGLGISNYGIKKALPKLIVTAVLVNLSFLICSLAIDVSNVVGNGLRELFKTVEESAIYFGSTSGEMTYSGVYGAVIGGTAIAVGAGMVAFELGTIWMLIPVVLGAIVSVVIGLITVALRQAVVALLVMVSPLAMVARILPNTEGWFEKWKNLLYKMLIFYPMFSLLFGASSLAGTAIIASAKSGFMVLLGIAVQIFPLIFSWSLMKMSGTFLGKINAGLHSIASRPLAINRGWADSHRQLTKQRMISSPRAYTPSLRLMQFVDKRRVSREMQIDEQKEISQLRGAAYRAGLNYRRDKSVSRRGERDYAAEAQKMDYQREVARHKNNVERGLGDVKGLARNSAQKARLEKIDWMNINASDQLHMERARGEMIEFENARWRHNRMEDAINFHLDEKNMKKADGTRNDNYKVHFDDFSSDEALRAKERYKALKDIMQGEEQSIQYAAADAAFSYDTQINLLGARYQKYFEMTPPTKDVEYRLGELTKRKDSAQLIDAIIPGLRILNQRGDTDILREHLSNILNKDIGGGIKLGTHASQSLASFLQLEVRDKDPFLRRFGKYLNLETAAAFNKNVRKELYVTYDEYIKGYHEEPDGSILHAKRDIEILMEGTSLDGIERTALPSFDESLLEAYTEVYYDGDKKRRRFKPQVDPKTGAEDNGRKSFEDWMKKRKNIEKATGSAFVSATQKFASGSEQQKSAANWKMGLHGGRKDVHTGETGKIMGMSEYYQTDDAKEYKGLFLKYRDEDGKLVDWGKEVDNYYLEQTADYIDRHTPGQAYGLRSDWFTGLTQKLVDLYAISMDDPEEAKKYGWNDEFKNKWGDLAAEYTRAKIEYAPVERGEITNKAEKERLKKKYDDIRERIAGVAMQVWLNKTGKLQKMHKTSNYGAANNAKDWTRRVVGVNDGARMKYWKGHWAAETSRNNESVGGTANNTADVTRNNIYNGDDINAFNAALVDIENHMHNRNDVEEYYGETCKLFAGLGFMKEYERLYVRNKDLTVSDLKSFLQEKLEGLLDEGN